MKTYIRASDLIFTIDTIPKNSMFRKIGLKTVFSEEDVRKNPGKWYVNKTHNLELVRLVETFVIKMTRNEAYELYTNVLSRPEDSAFDIDLGVTLDVLLKNGFEGFYHMTDRQLEKFWSQLFIKEEGDDAEVEVSVISEFASDHIRTDLTVRFFEDESTWTDNGCRYSSAVIKIVP